MSRVELVVRSVRAWSFCIVCRWCRPSGGVPSAQCCYPGPDTYAELNVSISSVKTMGALFLFVGGVFLTPSLPLSFFFLVKPADVFGILSSKTGGVHRGGYVRAKGATHPRYPGGL